MYSVCLRIVIPKNPLFFVIFGTRARTYLVVWPVVVHFVLQKKSGPYTKQPKILFNGF